MLVRFISQDVVPGPLSVSRQQKSIYASHPRPNSKSERHARAVHPDHYDDVCCCCCKALVTHTQVMHIHSLVVVYEVRVRTIVGLPPGGEPQPHGRGGSRDDPR